MEGIRALKASQGIENYDVNAMATRQEMRSFVCGQCHVEYYFKGPEKRLVYPWSKGLKVENIFAYYDETVTRTGRTPTPARPRSRPNTLNSRCTIRASTLARVLPAPTATCLTSAKAR